MPEHPQDQPGHLDRDYPIPMPLPLGQDLGGLLRMSLLIQCPCMIPLRRFSSADDLLRLSRRVPAIQR
jgi:hypothetical protein